MMLLSSAISMAVHSHNNRPRAPEAIATVNNRGQTVDKVPCYRCLFSASICIHRDRVCVRDREQGVDDVYKTLGQGEMV